MHLQAAVEGYDVFTRSLSIGPQTRVMHYDVTQEHHFRYTPDRDFLSPALEHEVTTISRLVNAFFAGTSTPASRSSRTGRHTRSTTPMHRPISR